MRVVIDASALVETLMMTEFGLPADAVLNAPHLIDSEVASALRGRVTGGRLTPSEGREALDFLMRVHIRRHELRHLLPRVWSLRHDMTAYDASYVALAEALGVPLVTTDLRLARTAARYCGVITP